MLDSSAHATLMLETLIALLFAHVVADFVVQTRAQIEAKRRPWVFMGHIGCVAVLTAVALGMATFAGLAAVVLIAVSHAVIDALKIHPRVEARAAAMSFGALRLFAIDQLAHWLFAGLAAAFWPHVFARGFWPALLTAAQTYWLLVGFVLVGGFWLATRVGHLLLALLLDGFQRAYRESVDSPDSPQLPGAGAWIGWLERTLVFLFVLLGQFNAIGFVIAAKSVLRFQHARQPRVSEIVIIGTLASFGWAIIVALLVQVALVGLRL